MSHTINQIRDLINEPAIKGELMSDPQRWDAVCNAMDCLSRGGSLQERIDATNVLAAEANEQPLGPGASEDDLRESIQRVGRGLERRNRRARKGYSARPLGEHFTEFKNLGYATEKIGAVTRSSSDMMMAKGFLAPLEELVAAVRTGLNARGLYGDEETADLLRVLARIRAYTDGAPHAPSEEDLDLLVRHAFSKLWADLQAIVAEVDEADAEH